MYCYRHISYYTSLSIYNYDGCIVHHVGRMGEGHYIATVLRSATTTTTLTKEEEKQGGATGGTAEYKSNNNGTNKRDNNSNKNNKNTSPSKNNNKSTPLLPTLPIQQGGAGEGEEWICYNDNSVTSIDIDEIICSSSAYVLFYIRKDMRSQTIEALFPPTTQASPSRAGVGAAAGGVSASSSSSASPTRKPTAGPGEARGSILSLVGAKNPLTPLRSLGSKQTSNNSLNDSEHTTNDGNNSNNIKLPKPRNRLPSTREGEGVRPVSMSTSPPSASASAGGGSGVAKEKKVSATGHNSTQHTHNSGVEEEGEEKGGQSSGCRLS